MIRVLFVCTGNICRSPMAEGALRSVAATVPGLAVEIESAGTHGYHTGEPPDRRAQRAAAGRGHDIAGQRARPVESGDFEIYDYIVALDRGHLERLRAICPPGRDDRLHLLMDFADGPRGRDVPDPYYGGAHDFERALDMIEHGVAGLAAAIRQSR